MYFFLVKLIQMNDLFYSWFCKKAHEQDKALCLPDSLYLTQGIHKHIINYSRKQIILSLKR